MDTDYLNSVLASLGLQENPIGMKLRLTILTNEGNQRSFNVTIENYHLGYGYVELYIPIRRIKGIRFDRLLHQISGNRPVGKWIALAHIPSAPGKENEDHWIAQWCVLRFEPQGR